MVPANGLRWLLLPLMLGLAGCEATPEIKAVNAFPDTLEFHIHVRGSRIGTMSSAMDLDGNYTRTFRLELAGQEAEYRMTIEPYGTAVWKRIRVTSPSEGEVIVDHEGNQARIRGTEGTRTVRLPGTSYVLWDDFGVILESLVFRRYDFAAGGTQRFTRVRPGDRPFEVALTSEGDTTIVVRGKPQRLLVFDQDLNGLHTRYWLDEELRVIRTENPVQYAVGVRAGYEDLVSLDEPPGQRRSFRVPMRDGVELATDVFLPGPDAAGPWPAILIRTPYKKEMLELEGLAWSREGYALVVQDVRGRFGSEGAWEPLVHERLDGYDAVEWVAAQPWCGGKVGMFGGSYLGYAQFLAAVERPPHLVTIVPNVVPPDPFYNFPYERGAFFVLGAARWLELVETEATGDLGGSEMRRILKKDAWDLVDHLPVIDLDREILGREIGYWRRWIEHDTQDAYWDRAAYLSDLADLDIPVLLQSGWFDGDGIGSKLAYAALTEGGNEHVKLVLGPWGHEMYSTTSIAGHDLGDEAGLDLEALYRRWFGYWLKGEPTGILEESLVQLYVIGDNRWESGDRYPLEGTEMKRLYLSSREGAVSLKGDGRLTWEPVEDGRDHDRYVYDPGDPTPEWLWRFEEGGFRNYEKVTRRRKDLLVYSTDPAEEPFTVLGPMRMVLSAATDAVDTDWYAVLYKVDGSDLMPISRGIMRARYRDSVTAPSLLEPGRVYTYDLDLWQTGVTVGAGEQLRLEIASCSFPFFSRNLNTGGHNETETEHVKAEQAVYHSAEHPSYVVLPVLKTTGIH
jgi:putative CocE/NonD family hydrolase